MRKAPARQDCARASYVVRPERDRSREKKAAPKNGTAFFICGFVDLSFRIELFGLALLSQLLNLHPLRLDLLLLLLDLSLSLLIGIFLILHRVADYVAGTAAEYAADRSARERMADCRSDERAATCTDCGSAEGALFTSRERLPRASRYDERSCQRDTRNYP